MTSNGFDIIYICSNSSIARANLHKLQVSGAGEQAFPLATRLTMLATELAPLDGNPGLANNKLNFVSFTPERRSTWDILPVNGVNEKCCSTCLYPASLDGDVRR